MFATFFSYEKSSNDTIQVVAPSPRHTTAAAAAIAGGDASDSESSGPFVADVEYEKTLHAESLKRLSGDGGNVSPKRARSLRATADDSEPTARAASTPAIASALRTLALSSSAAVDVNGDDEDENTSVGVDATMRLAERVTSALGTQSGAALREFFLHCAKKMQAELKRPLRLADKAALLKRVRMRMHEATTTADDVAAAASSPTAHVSGDTSTGDLAWQSNVDDDKLLRLCNDLDLYDEFLANRARLENTDDADAAVRAQTGVAMAAYAQRRTLGVDDAAHETLERAVLTAEAPDVDGVVKPPTSTATLSVADTTPAAGTAQRADADADVEALRRAHVVSSGVSEAYMRATSTPPALPVEGKRVAASGAVVRADGSTINVQNMAQYALTAVMRKKDELTTRVSLTPAEAQQHAVMSLHTRTRRLLETLHAVHDVTTESGASPSPSLGSLLRRAEGMLRRALVQRERPVVDAETFRAIVSCMMIDDDTDASKYAMAEHVERIGDATAEAAVAAALCLDGVRGAATRTSRNDLIAAARRRSTAWQSALQDDAWHVLLRNGQLNDAAIARSYAESAASADAQDSVFLKLVREGHLMDVFEEAMRESLRVGAADSRASEKAREFLRQQYKRAVARLDAAKRALPKGTADVNDEQAWTPEMVALRDLARKYEAATRDTSAMTALVDEYLMRRAFAQLECVTRDYAADYLREPLVTANNERACRNGARCLCVSLAASIRAADDESRSRVSGGFVAREFLLPSEAARWRETRVRSAVPAMCYVCELYATKAMVKSFKSLYADADDVAPVTCKQRFYCAFDTPGQYNSETCALEANTGRRFVGAVSNMVDFRATNYTYDVCTVRAADGTVHDGVRCVREADHMVFH